MTADKEETEDEPKLQWGETPWDNKTREELLLDVKRMYSALTSLYSCQRMSADLPLLNGKGKENPYYAKGGSGGRALEKARQILAPLHEEIESSDTWRSYFRYANDLLFDDETGYEIGSGWLVCPTCGLMIGRHRDIDQAGMRCGDAMPFTSCDGILRKLEWADLAPKKGENRD